MFDTSPVVSAELEANANSCVSRCLCHPCRQPKVLAKLNAFFLPELGATSLIVTPQQFGLQGRVVSTPCQCHRPRCWCNGVAEGHSDQLAATERGVQRNPVPSDPACSYPGVQLLSGQAGVARALITAGPVTTRVRNPVAVWKST